MATICKDFLISILGLVGYEELMADRVEDVAYLSDVCQYILQEITAPKTADEPDDGESMSFNLFDRPSAGRRGDQRNCLFNQSRSQDHHPNLAYPRGHNLL